MSWLEISNIALWIGFILMAVMNLALLRQIGVLYERVAPAGALMSNQLLKVGAEAPQLTVNALDGKPVRVGGAAGGKAQLLFFVSPDCPVCNQLSGVFRSAAKQEAGWLESILASDGGDLPHAQYVKDKGLEDFPYVVSELLGRSYGVSKLPYAVLIDEQGKIASMGIVNSREHLESLFEAKERNVASIQEFMQKKGRAADGAVQMMEVEK